jgi:hypothetical protein
MKNKYYKFLLFHIIFLIISVSNFGQTNKKLKGKPTTLEETYIYLDQIFNDTDKYCFLTLPEDIATSRLHHSLGMWIRNNWGLWRNSKLKQYFLNNGIFHPDDMSGIILTSYHRYLNGKTIDLEEQIKKYQDFYNGRNFLKDRTPDSVLLKFFPINDTIFISIYANYRRLLFTYASSVRATAIVREHREDILFVEIIKIETEKKYKPEKKVGDSFEIRPIYCSLIPPKGWILQKK